MNKEKLLKKGKVIILATGGTIAGVGESGKIMGYQPGSLSVDDLLKEVPQLKSVAYIETMQICNVNSDDITDRIWLKLARTVNELSKDPLIAGFVITHGTDTLEETAYFLNLVVKTKKPVVLTGSMRPATSISADGPMNLYEAVCVAISEKAIGKGVLAVFSDHIYSARQVSKLNSFSLMAISSGEMGAIGIVRDGDVHFYENPDKTHTVDSCFMVGDLEKLPKVSILYFYVDADPALLEYAIANSKGVVIAGAGAGEYSLKFKEVIEKASVPIVISSRINASLVPEKTLLSEKTIAADNLPPQKAAVLLRLCLTMDLGIDEIRKIFAEY